MRVRYLNPVGTDVYDAAMADILNQFKQPDTTVEVVSLPSDRPKHLEYHAYEALVVADIVAPARLAARDCDAFVIGCFYDVGLRDAREVSGRAIVTAPCESACAIARSLGNTFSVLVGRRKWIPKMAENVRLYGHEHAMASMRPMELSVHDFQNDDTVYERMLSVGRACVEEDGAEVLMLGCTASFGFCERLQEALGVPVLDAMLAPFKYAEFLGDAATRLGWTPSRKWGSEAPPESEIADWGLFAEAPQAAPREAAAPEVLVPAE